MNPMFTEAAGAVVALAIPVTYALAALLTSRQTGAGLFSRGLWGTGLALGLAMVLLGKRVLGGFDPLPHDAAPLFVALSQGLRVDGLTTGMLMLVTFLAHVIVRYSRTYLAGEPGQARYLRWFLATLAAVSLLVAANHLLVVALCWTATSLAIHQLLTFYPERPQALIAAHKKFLVSRLGDVLVFGAIGLLGWQVGSLHLDDVFVWARQTESPPWPVTLATVLLALGACLKCAQLPFHGWLIQVMEAPTPVSALLHAGVVNIGGFLMIRLAPLMVKAELAQFVLVGVGATTAALAALVMTTRVSIKVRLAWSTCAQMGFMLVECGLGAYHLALLHLVAHSLYKAHAFLASGSTVDLWRAGALETAAPEPRLAPWFVNLVLATAGVAAVGGAFGVNPTHEPSAWAMAWGLSLAGAALMTRAGAGGLTQGLKGAFYGLAVTTLYFAWHVLVAQVPLGTENTGDPSPGMFVRLAVTGSVFLGLYVIAALMAARPQSPWARALYPQLFAGFYLDEFFTRLTFRLWPAKMPARSSAERGDFTTQTIGA